MEETARQIIIPVLLVRGRQSDLLSEEGARRFLNIVKHAEYADIAGARYEPDDTGRSCGNSHPDQGLPS